MSEKDILKSVSEYFDNIYLLRSQSEIIRQFLILISKLYKCESLIFLPLKNNPQMLGFKYYPDIEKFVEKERITKMNSQLISEVLRTKDVISLEGEKIEVKEVFGDNTNLRNLIMLPIVLKENIFGILFIGLKEKQLIDVVNLKYISKIVSFVLFETNVYEIMNKLVNDLKVSYEISKVMIEEMNTDRFINRLFEKMIEHFGYEIIAIFILSKDKRFAVLEYTVEKYSNTKGFKFPLNRKSIISYVVKNGISYYCSDVDKDPYYYPGIEGVKSEFAVPLKIKDKIIGVIDIESKKVDDFPESTRQLIESFAALIAVSIENKRLFEESARLSKIDGLTGVLNRRTLEEEIKKSIDKCNTKKISLSILFIDIDNFKELNDKYGHLMGDKILKYFGSFLKKKTEGHICGRYGGDEFVCALLNKDIKGAINIGEMIIKDIKNFSILKRMGISLNISIGISFLNKDGKTLDELIDSADRKCYFAKRKGGNRFKI